MNAGTPNDSRICQPDDSTAHSAMQQYPPITRTKRVGNQNRGAYGSKGVFILFRHLPHYTCSAQDERQGWVSWGLWGVAAAAAVAVPQQHQQ